MRTLAAPQLRRTALAVALLLAGTGAGAQQVPGAGDALRQAQPPRPPPSPPPALPPIGGALQPPMQALPAGGQRVRVSRIELEGNRNLASAVLLGLLADAPGREFTLAELEDLAGRLTRHYRGAGYFVARAYVPAQELRGGVLTLRVVEGNYGQFQLHNTSLVRDAVVQALLDDIKGRDVVSIDTLERAMLIINDTPGVQVVRADVMPGAAVGTSDFAIGTVAGPRAGGFVIADNYGSASTGRNRASFNADWNSPSGRGDRLSLSGLGTSGDLVNGRLAYSTLVAWNGTRASVALSQTNYSLGGSFAALDATGRARNLDLGLSTPVQRTQRSSVTASATLSRRHLRDEIRSTGTRTPKQSTALSADVQLRQQQSWFGREGMTTAGATLTAGRLSIGDEVARALDAAGPRSAGHFAKLGFAAARDMYLTPRLAFNATLKGQLALSGRALDGSERMSVSGPDGVVAYSPNELAGDSALLAHAELSAALLALPQGGQLSAFLFADAGHARLRYSTLASAHRSLSDAGLGLAFRSGHLFGKLHVARRTAGAPLSEAVGRTRVLLQVGAVF